MNTHCKHLADMTQWVRLREAQFETARLIRNEKRRALDAAIAAMKVRQTEFDNEQRCIQQLKQWPVGPHARLMPRVLEQLHAHQSELADRLERCEYALIDDRNSVLAASKELEAAQALWSMAGQRVETAKQLLSDARKRSVDLAERHLERDTDSSARYALSVM